MLWHHYCLSHSVVPDSCDPMYCSPPGSSVHGISQAGILERVAISFFRGSSWPRDQTHVSCFAALTAEPQGKPYVLIARCLPPWQNMQTVLQGHVDIYTWVKPCFGMWESHSIKSGLKLSLRCSFLGSHSCVIWGELLKFISSASFYS